MKPIIVFDFDGVIILGSERIKQKCWLELFQPRGEKEVEALNKAVERYSQGRGSRYDIVRDTLNNLEIPKDQISELTEEYCNKYAQNVRTEILAEGVRAEDRRALESLAQKATLFINTATPQTAIEDILEKLNIGRLFKKVYGLNGSSLNKTDILRMIAKNESISVEDLIFIGDGEGDRKAALEAGCLFIGVCNDHNHWSGIKHDFMIFNSASDVITYLFSDLLKN